MEEKGGILALGLDKKHFQDKFDFIHNKFNNISCYGSWKPINKDTNISKIDRIDISLLYDQSNLFEAHPLVKKTSLENDFLQAMYECESIFFSTIDRCSSKKISIIENKSYFYDLLIFFKSFFEIKKDINFVFFPTTPHFPVDIVLFFVAKYFLKNTIILNRTDFNNKFYFRSDWRDLHKFDHKFDYIPSNKIQTTDIEKESKFIKYSKNLNDLSVKSFKRKNNLYRSIIDFFKLFKSIINYYRFRDVTSPFHLNKGISLLQIYFLVIRRYKQNKKLTKFYKENMVSPNLELDYVYFPLHFQPERSTVPEGLFFSNQLRAIELLRESLPSSFFIYIKEHPRQFDPEGVVDLRKISARKISFYKNIVSLPNTRLLDISQDSNLLINKAKIVTTITGSSGWQAILEKKPTFVFGKPWYSDFKKCYNIDSKEDIIKALKEINTSDFNIENMEIRNFVNKMEGKLFDGYIGEMYHDDKLPYKKITESFSSNLIIYLKNLQIRKEITD